MNFDGLWPGEREATGRLGERARPRRRSGAAKSRVNEKGTLEGAPGRKGTLGRPPTDGKKGPSVGKGTLEKKVPRGN